MNFWSPLKIQFSKIWLRHFALVRHSKCLIPGVFATFLSCHRSVSLKFSLPKQFLEVPFCKIGMLAVLFGLLVGCEKDAEKKALVVYYSQTGTTKALSGEFQKNLNARSVELLLENPYPSTYDSTIARVKEERSAKAWPKLLNAKVDLSKIDTVYLGYPIMFGTFAPPIYTFLDSNDLTGKVIVPFCTYGSGGMQNSAKEIQDLAAKASVTKPFGISHKRISKAAHEVVQFLAGLSNSENEEHLVGAYSEARELSDEDSTVFFKATADYAYLHLVPKSVSSQVVAGMNYIFECEMTGPDGIPSKARVLVFAPLPGQGDPEMIRVDR